MAMSPEKLAERIEKWRLAGFSMAVVNETTATLQLDKTESQGRAPRKQGRLVGTIRIVRPSATAAARRGYIQAMLAAGNKKRKDGVPYARVLQEGGIFISPTANATHTARHVIIARKARYTERGKLVNGVLRIMLGGRAVFTRGVKHPGSKFPKLDFMRVNRDRASTRLDAAVQRSANREIA